MCSACPEILISTSDPPPLVLPPPLLPPLQPRRLSFGGFGTLRKKRSDEGDEYVCPMDVATPTSFQRTRVQSYKEEEELEQVRSSAPNRQRVEVEAEV